MLYTSLSDEELRNIEDLNPEDFSALREASSRFVNGSSQESGEIERLKDELKVVEHDLAREEDASASLGEALKTLRVQYDNLRMKLKELADA